MTIKMTRKGFLGALGGGTVVLWLQACGGGGGDGDDDGGPMQCGASSITGNHGHALTIPEADLSSATDKVYSIQGSAGHDHMVTLTAAQLAMLRAGQSVDATSTSASGHDHVVTARCT